METSGFYKYENNNNLLYGPNFVYGPYDNYRLVKEQHDTYTYPVDGWYWFDSLEEAQTFFNIQPEPSNEII